MITTSYFGKLPYIKNPIAITAYKPKWFNGLFYQKLSPPALLVDSYKKEEITKDEYSILYYEFILSKLNQNQIYNEIINQFGDDATLLCYEKPDDFCHRHLVREWFRRKNIIINELEF